MKKTIITVVGNDTVGIIAKVCTYLADNNVNILDISQTIVQGYFNSIQPLSLFYNDPSNIQPIQVLQFFLYLFQYLIFRNSF